MGYQAILVVSLSLFHLGKCGVTFYDGIAALTMPEGLVPKKEWYACDTIETREVFGGKEVGYITLFDPYPDIKYVHHYLLFTCDKPVFSKEFGSCPPCKVEEILYGWGHGGPPTELPRDVSFKIDSRLVSHMKFQVSFTHSTQGGMLRYAGRILFQIHFADTNEEGIPDRSELRLTIQYMLTPLF